jgi:hypothetical protein
MFSTVKIQNILHFLALFVKNHKKYMFEAQKDAANFIFPAIPHYRPHRKSLFE